MTRPASAADFTLPATFVDDVMRRVAVAPAPMPVRTFWSAILDRSALDLAGSIAIAWRLLLTGGRLPLMVRAQALALVVLVAVSVGGTGTLAAAAAYRAVAPIVFRDDPRDLLSESTPTAAPDVVPHASPLVIAAPDRPEGRTIARPPSDGVATDEATGEATGDGASNDAPGRDRAARAADADGTDGDDAPRDGGSGEGGDRGAASGDDHPSSDDEAKDGDGAPGGSSDGGAGDGSDGGD